MRTDIYVVPVAAHTPPTIGSGIQIGRACPDKVEIPLGCPSNPAPSQSSASNWEVPPYQANRPSTDMQCLEKHVVPLQSAEESLPLHT